MKKNRKTVDSPCLTIDLEKIEHNARIIVDLCKKHGIEVAGVTKATCGNPDVARAMLRGGVSSIADSRLENIHRLRKAGVDSLLMLLRVPPLSGVDEVVETVDVSLNSDLNVLKALSDAAIRRGKIQDIIIMVDLGDLREGVWPDELLSLVKEAGKLAGIRIRGLGTNLACFGGVMPDEKNMKKLVGLAAGVERGCGIRLDWVSGINSSGLDLIAKGKMPKRVNHARIGEAILLGRETTHRKPWPETFQDAFILHAEVLELYKKPSMPIGAVSENAFGKKPLFREHGERLRALLNVGREDMDPEGLTSTNSKVEVIGASSDYLVVEIVEKQCGIKVGDSLSFSLNYSALLAAMTSKYVKKQVFSGCTTMKGL